MVIFGGTGDLSQRKLLPGLHHLYESGRLPDNFKIVGLANVDMDDDGFRAFAKEKIEATGMVVNDSFLSLLHYQTGDFHDAEAYQNLAHILDELDAGIGQCTNKLFHLAVPPHYLDKIFDHLAESKLAVPCGGELGWTRVMVEKPFGSNTKTAQELDDKLGTLFKEEQIYRIDHYLAKDTIQNILTFRFSNTLFEGSWSADHIASIHLTLSEDIGVETRGVLYDGVGALRDVGQNHMLQMLALVTMDRPAELKAKDIRDARHNALASLSPENTKSIRGQYEGYLDIDDVADDSGTETYFLIKTQLNGDRWNDVPVYIEGGKALSKQCTQVKVVFKSPLACVCGDHGEHDHKNTLTIQIQPQHEIKMKFWVKKPGIEFDIEEKELTFAYAPEEYPERAPEAYEKVIYDCIVGDQMLFVSTDEVKAAWAFITPIMEQWSDNPVYRYAQGSDGPDERSELLP